MTPDSAESSLICPRSAATSKDTSISETRHYVVVSVASHTALASSVYCSGSLDGRGQEYIPVVRIQWGFPGDHRQGQGAGPA